MGSDHRLQQPETAKVSQTVDSKSAVDYLNADSEPEPSSVTGLGTHFHNTFDPALKQDAPQLPHSSLAPQPTAAAKDKLAATDSTMTTAQLQKAALEGDPNGLTGAASVRKEKQQEGDPTAWSGRY